MGRNNSTLAVILSADLADLSPNENILRTVELIKDLQKTDYGFKRVIGCYKGKREASFVVAINTLDRLEYIKSLALWKYGQESILLLNTDQSGQLLYRNGSSETLPGTLKQVPSTDGLDAYTIDQNTIYTFKE